MHLVALRLQRCAQEGNQRALAVGAGDMHRRRQGLLRITERRQKPLDAAERQVDSLGVQAQKAVEDRFTSRQGGRHRREALAAAFPLSARPRPAPEWPRCARLGRPHRRRAAAT